MKRITVFTGGMCLSFTVLALHHGSQISQVQCTLFCWWSFLNAWQSVVSVHWSRDTLLAVAGLQQGSQNKQVQCTLCCGVCLAPGRTNFIVHWSREAVIAGPNSCSLPGGCNKVPIIFPSYKQQRWTWIWIVCREGRRLG